MKKNGLSDPVNPSTNPRVSSQKSKFDKTGSEFTS